MDTNYKFYYCDGYECFQEKIFSELRGENTITRILGRIEKEVWIQGEVKGQRDNTYVLLSLE